jgi:uncharacterized protein YndB with AHSA1/START domain
METTNTLITIQTTVNAPIAKAWECYTTPEHITQWNFAIDTWQCPSAANDLRAGGKFSSRMEAKDGSFGFDFSGVYDEVITHSLIAYHLDDNRKVKVTFSEAHGNTTVTTHFEAETENSIEMQKGGWQAILDNFKKHVEAH